MLAQVTWRHLTTPLYLLALLFCVGSGDLKAPTTPLNPLVLLSFVGAGHLEAPHYVPSMAHALPTSLCTRRWWWFCDRSSRMSVLQVPWPPAPPHQCSALMPPPARTTVSTPLSHPDNQCFFDCGTHRLISKIVSYMFWNLKQSEAKSVDSTCFECLICKFQLCIAVADLNSFSEVFVFKKGTVLVRGCHKFCFVNINILLHEFAFQLISQWNLLFPPRPQTILLMIIFFLCFVLWLTINF